MKQLDNALRRNEQQSVVLIFGLYIRFYGRFLLHELLMWLHYSGYFDHIIRRLQSSNRIDL